MLRPQQMLRSVLRYVAKEVQASRLNVQGQRKLARSLLLSNSVEDVRKLNGGKGTPLAGDTDIVLLSLEAETAEVLA